MYFLLWMSCAQEEASLYGYLGEDVYVDTDAHSNILREFSFFGTDDDGFAYGFNLDDKVSDTGEEESCGHGDLESPDGMMGIDNQLAKIWTLIEPVAGSIAQDLLQGAINEGRVLLTLELVNVENIRNDSDVSLRIFTALGDPEIGTMGLISPNQTFSIDTGADFVEVEGVSIQDGRVQVGPVDFSMPLDILELQTTLNIQKGSFDFIIEEDGTFHGYMGGAISVSEFLTDIKNTDAAEEAAVVEALFINNADMGYDSGDCDLFSLAFSFSGTNAFVVRSVEGSE